jgi:MoaA/NifB/PqqE/SkfB family radical SAM enzyme
MSLSFGPNSVPRVCCHQNGALKNTSSTSLDVARLLKHNDDIKTKMINKQIPSECIECHQLESNGCQSPRLHYLEKFPDISENLLPKIEYLDITIDNRCNLECLMCSPHYSNRLNSFFNKSLGLGNIEKWELNFTNSEIDSLLPDLKMLTLTGGEPLLSPRAMSFLSYVSESADSSHIDLRLFSNLTFLPENLETVLNKFKTVEFILSIDSIKENYELVRYPAKWNDIDTNITTLLALNLPKTTLNFHVVVMAGNWNYLVDLLKYFQEKKINSNLLFPILGEIENPLYLHPTVLPKNEYQAGFDKIQDFISHTFPQSDSQEKELNSFKNLIQKINEKDYKQYYIEYKTYMNKIMIHRGKP